MVFSGESAELDRRLGALLGLRVPAIAITFAAPPEGVPRIERPGLASCAYWRAAADGAVFYTEAADHHGCPIGAHTHHVPMPEGVRAELEGMLGQMIGLQYLAAEEIPKIPTRAAPFTAAVYAPLARAPLPPDLVLVRATPRKLMLLQEAAQACGAVGDAPPLGRPTCAVLPLAENLGKTAVSLGCIGNRVYTDAGDDEAYMAIPGGRLADIVGKLEVIATANTALEQFHRERSR
jgi:uncharacterized protein (DUF169 family)